MPRENRVVHGRAMRAVGIMAGLLATGTLGYHLLAGWTLFDAFYMTVITITTVGYGETHELGTAGRAFTIFLIVAGAGNIAYALSSMTEFFAKGGWDAYRRRARMHRQLAHVSDHTIVCGYGRLGAEVVRTLREHGAPLVVIEASDTVVQVLAASGEFPFVHGDAARDEILALAGIDRAKTLVTALHDDASNVFLTLTARVLNPALVIYGKADDPHSLSKLQRAGAQYTFSPSLVAGHRIAWQILRPHVTDLVEIQTAKGDFELAVEEFEVRELTDTVDRTLAETTLWGTEDAMVLAIKTADGRIVFPPKANYRLQGLDRLVVMAKADVIARFSATRR